jgi:murein DD-endopeptidase MepM/ murein hydrolase activator NlpD
MASPIKGVPVSTAFGVKGSRWSTKRHEGVDFACPVGTNVLAPCDGEVVKVGQVWGKAFGQHSVLLKVAEGYLLFAHCSKYLVAVGDKVKKGQHIAEVGLEGNTTGAHLHMELQAKSTWTKGGGINPAAILAK